MRRGTLHKRSRELWSAIEEITEEFKVLVGGVFRVKTEGFFTLEKGNRTDLKMQFGQLELVGADMPLVNEGQFLLSLRF
jgi:hypothetical protein